MLAKLSDPYIICAAAGILGSLLVIFFLAWKRSFDGVRIFLCSFFAYFFMFVGAHLMFFLVGLPEFGAKYGASIYDIPSFFDAVFNASSGMVFYGGLFGAIIGVVIFSKVARENTHSYLNIACCAFPMMHAFGRLGCTLGGCCYGIEYHGILALKYTEAHINPGISDHIADFPRFPVQPMEAILELAICVMLVIIYLRTGDQYSITAIYLFTYGIVRFCDEFLRGDTIRGLWGPFSTSQWIALACIIGVMIYSFIRRSKTASC